MGFTVCTTLGLRLWWVDSAITSLRSRHAVHWRADTRFPYEGSFNVSFWSVWAHLDERAIFTYFGISEQNLPFLCDRDSGQARWSKLPTFYKHVLRLEISVKIALTSFKPTAVLIIIIITTLFCLLQKLLFWQLILIKPVGLFKKCKFINIATSSLINIAYYLTNYYFWLIA